MGSPSFPAPRDSREAPSLGEHRERGVNVELTWSRAVEDLLASQNSYLHPLAGFPCLIQNPSAAAGAGEESCPPVCSSELTSHGPDEQWCVGGGGKTRGEKRSEAGDIDRTNQELG